MQRQILHGKIHRATVTECCVDYEGSVTIDPFLLEAADILSGEKVLIANLNNGARIESYAIGGERGAGTICLNGGAAKHGKKGDLLILDNRLVAHAGTAFNRQVGQRRELRVALANAMKG